MAARPAASPGARGLRLALIADRAFRVGVDSTLVRGKNSEGGGRGHLQVPAPAHDQEPVQGMREHCPWGPGLRPFIKSTRKSTTPGRSQARAAELWSHAPRHHMAHCKCAQRACFTCYHAEPPILLVVLPSFVDLYPPPFVDLYPPTSNPIPPASHPTPCPSTTAPFARQLNL